MAGPLVSNVAVSTPFEPNRNPDYNGNAGPLVATNVQDAIEEVQNLSSNSASLGFTFGRSGTSNAGTWLLNETVPSNIAGRTISIYDGVLAQIAISSEAADTFDVQIYEHDGVTYVLLATISLVSQRTKTQDYTSINVTKGKQLAAKISSGSGKNIVAMAILRGKVTP